MDEIYKKITNQFNYLTDLGLTFDYKETNGKLGDRILKIFSYNNEQRKKKIEIVYCIAGNNQRLYGFLINYNPTNQTPLHLQNNIPFDRLRCFFDEGKEIIFWGSEQFELKYKLREFNLIIERFKACITSDSWINYNALLGHEKKVYSLTLEPTQYYTWADQIKSDGFIKNYLTVIFDSSTEPAYETYGLRLQSKEGIQFHITHGNKSRDDDGFYMKVFYPDKRTADHEFTNTGTETVVQFIRQMIST